MQAAAPSADGLHCGNCYAHRLLFVEHVGRSIIYRCDECGWTVAVQHWQPEAEDEAVNPSAPPPIK